MKNLILTIILSATSILVTSAQTTKPVVPKLRFNRQSTEYGDIPLYSKDKNLIQEAAIAADFNGDGKDEFIIAEKTSSPSIVMYVHLEGKKWEIYSIEKRNFAGSESIATADIDGDGDLDIAMASSEGSEIYWWENPSPNLSPNKQWKRNYIKKKGASGHGELIFGDFDNDQKLELAYWQDGTQSLVIAQAPENVSKSDEWSSEIIYTYSTDGQMLQRSNGTELQTKPINYHCGIYADDINNDGVTDLLAGGMWFQYINDKYQCNSIDLSYSNSRIISGNFIHGDRKEVIMVSGNGIGPVMMYQYINGTWMPTIIEENARLANSLTAIDFDKDGDLDIISAELKSMEVPDPKVFILLNKGNGKFDRVDVPNSIESQNTCAADFNGDGDIDILGKPYSFDTPRIEIWMQNIKK